MGFGDWVKDRVDDAGEFLEDGLDEGKQLLGEVVDSGAHGVGDLLDKVGADGAADWVDARGDDFADAMGADVAELELGETDDPKQLVHGEAATITETAGHLETFASSFGSTASGLSGIDVGNWSGSASLGFDSVASVQPGKWRTAAESMTAAADAWTAYASTVTWAQGQAKNAITQYDKGKKASEAAVTAYNAKVDTYNAGVTAGKPAEELPDKPGPFTDPGTADMEAAQQTLRSARQQRDEAAQRATSAITSATAQAPQEPEFTDRMGADLGDLAQMQQVWSAHVTAGAFKATGELVKFARGLNPTDPYNIRHPAAYVEGLSNTVTGLIHTANHPTEVVGAIIGSGWTTDPAEAFGKLIPTIVGTAATGGGEGVAAATARLGSRAAVDGVETAATRATVDGIESAAQRGAGAVADDAAATRGASIADDVKPMTSDPVDLGTGTVLLEQTDLELPGLLPLVLARKHVSTWRYGVWFGSSWTSTLDERLDLTDDAVLLVGGDGTILTWDRPTLDDGPVLPREGAARTLERTDTGGWTVRDPRSGQVRHYFGRREDVVPLTAVVDANGHRISIARNELNAPVEVRHTGGYRVLVETDGTRVVSYRAAHGEDARWDGSLPEEGDAPGTEVVRFAHDGRGLLERVVNSSGHALQFFHDQAGRLLRWVDRNDTTYRYEYDEQGRCTATSGTGDALAVTIDYGVEPDGSRVTRCTDSLGATTTYHLNPRLQVERVVDPLGHVTQQSWDRRDRLVASTDPLGAVTRFEHDEAGRLVQVVRADGSRQTWQYDGPLDRPRRITLPDGGVWTHEHDARGNRTRVVDPAGAATAYSYDERGRLTSVTRADGTVTRVVSDAAGLVVSVTDPLGGTTLLERDELGRVVATADATGATTRLTWTPEGWLASRTLPDGLGETWAYDGEGNVLAHTDVAGRTTTRAYGPFDVPVAETTPDGATTEFLHDSELRLVRVTNPQGLTWDYAYDEAGRMVGETDFDGRVLSYDHDAAGQVVRRTNGAGETLALAHDALGRVVEQRAGDGRLSVFSHDALGRLTRATNPDSDVRLERDALGRVVAETVDGRTVASELDVLGRRVRRTTPSGSVTEWDHDDAGRILRLTVDGHEIGFDRDAVGREVRRTLGSTVLDQTYDVAGLLTAQTLVTVGGVESGSVSLADRLGGGAPATPAGPGPRVLQRRTYDYTHGHLTRLTDSRNGVRTFELDLLDRVVGVQGDGWSEAYAYDGSGNLTTSTTPATTTGDRELRGTLLTRAGDTRFTYDAQGRMVSRTRTRLSRKPDTWLFEWDAEDRMTGVRTPDGRRWRYAYDALGRRTAKERVEADGAVAERVEFTWDGVTLAEQTTAEEVTTWTHDGTRPLTQSSHHLDRSDQAAVDREFFSIVTDLVGAPTELVDSTGAITWHARRTVWGAPLDPAEVSPTPLRFPGQYADAETGLSYNLARYYDPETGRYASQDPLGLAPAPNPNAYVANPNELIDPLGLAPCAADQARAWQGSGNYPGVDQWDNVTLPKGTTVHAGEPGVSGFFASDASAAQVGSDARALNEGLQVGPYHGTYRPGLTAFKLTEDTPAARAIALANPQFGAGGLEQFFIPDWEKFTEPVVTRLMHGGPR